MKMNFLAIQHGAAVGAVQVIIMLVLYVVHTELLFNTWASLSTWVLIFVGLYLGIKAVREDEGGYISFGRAWGHGMLVAAAMTVLVVAFSVVLYNVIDPGLVDMAIRVVQDQMEGLIALMGGGEVDGVDFATLMEEEMRKSLTPQGLLKGSFGSLLVYAIPALIMAAVMRRKEPIDFK